MKKQRWIAGVLAGLMVLSLVGCGNAGNENAANENTQTEEWEVEYTIDKNGFEGGFMNKSLYYAKKDEKYGVFKLDGTKVKDYEWDYVVPNLYEDCFALGKKTDDKKYYYVLCDKDGKELFNTGSMPNARIQSYSEGVLQVTSSVRNSYDGFDSWYYDGKNNFSLMLELNENKIDAFCQSGGYYAGQIMMDTYATKATGEYRIAISKDGTVTWGPAGWVPYPYAVSDQGYINGMLYDTETGDAICMAVYNLKEDKLYKLPSDLKPRTDTYKVKGNVFVTVFGDGYMSITTTGNNLWGIYSIKTGKVTEEKYSDISIENYGVNDYILVANEDNSKWSYLDKNFKEVGTWYDCATDFYDGYAIIKDTDGKLYFINEKFEKVSKAIEGDYAYCDTQTGHFAIQKADGLIYTVQIKE